MPTASVNGQAPAKPAQLKGELVISGFRSGYGAGEGMVLAQFQDDVAQKYGGRTYELMLLDGQVYSSVCYLTASVMGDGLTAQPAVAARPDDGSGEKEPDADRAKD